MIKDKIYSATTARLKTEVNANRILENNVVSSIREAVVGGRYMTDIYTRSVGIITDLELLGYECSVIGEYNGLKLVNISWQE